MCVAKEVLLCSIEPTSPSNCKLSTDYIIIIIFKKPTTSFPQTAPTCLWTRSRSVTTVRAWKWRAKIASEITHHHNHTWLSNNMANGNVRNTLLFRMHCTTSYISKANVGGSWLCFTLRYCLVIVWSNQKWTGTGSGTSVIRIWLNRTESGTRYTPTLDCCLVNFLTLKMLHTCTYHSTT